MKDKGDSIALLEIKARNKILLLSNKAKRLAKSKDGSEATLIVASTK